MCFKVRKMQIPYLILIGLLLITLPGIATETVLNYSQEGIIDDQLASLMRNPPKSITKVIEEVRTEKNKLITLDLSRNHITDQSLGTVSTLWQAENSISLKEIDLSSNRISSETLHLFDSLLRKDDFKYLNIVDTPAATIDSKPYFSNLASQLLQKLIWIPERWVNAENWHLLLEERSDLINIIKELHNEYYKNKRQQTEKMAKDSQAFTNRTTKDFLDEIEQDYVKAYLDEELKSNQKMFREFLEKKYGAGLEKMKTDPDRAWSFGINYLRGREGFKQNNFKALQWFNYAIALGSINAIYSKGDLLINGDGIIKDFSEGEKLIRQAADKGHFTARKTLGLLSDDSEEESEEENEVSD